MRTTRLSCAIALGLYSFCGSIAVGQAGESFVKKSDVLFTQALRNEIEGIDHGLYGTYNSDSVMWGFTPPTYPSFSMDNFDNNIEGYINSILNHDAAGVDWVSRVEWDVIWGGMLTKYPETYEQAFAQRLDGSSLSIDWFPGHYFFSTHSPIFQEYLRWQIEDIAFFGEAGPGLVDALLFDSQQATPSHYFWGGDFSANCMENFSAWLPQNYSTAELTAMGIDDVANFHYGNFLIGLGWTAAEYEAQAVAVPNTIPLSGVFREFLQDWNNNYLASLVQFADSVAEQKGYPHKEGIGYIEVGTSSPILDPYWNGIRFAHTDEFDFYTQEFNHRASSEAPSSDVMLMYKLGEAIGKPLALTGQPNPDWDYMIDNPEAVDLVRSWIAQAYANGAVFMAPEHMWAYNDLAQRYYDPAAGDYDYIYAWIAANGYMFDDYESVAKVALVYSHRAYRGSDYAELDVFVAAAGLMEENIPYKLLVAGDSWWPKYLTDIDQQAALNQVTAVVTTEFNSVPLDTAQQSALDAVAHKRVLWPDTAAILALQPREISIDQEKVASFARSNPSHPHPNAPQIVHLVNRDYNAQSNSINVKSNVSVNIQDSLFDSSFIAARYNQAGQEPLELEVRRSGAAATVLVPNLANWGVLELFSALPIPAKDELQSPKPETRIEGFDSNKNASVQGDVLLDYQGVNNEAISRL